MEIASSKEILEDVTREYDKNPSGWSFFWSKSKGGGYNLLYVSQNSVRQIKLDSVYTANPVGVGAKLDIDLEKNKVPVTNFGLRPLSDNDLKYLESMGYISDGGILMLPKQITDQIKPVSSSYVQSGNSFIGPIIQSDRELVLGEAQALLDQKLNDSLKNMRKGREPSYIM
jgi:hypothetical protein